MPTVTNTVRRPDGTLATGRVTIDLVGTNGVPIVGYVTANDYSFVGQYSADIVAGVWSVSLTANSLITPAGTRWRVREAVDGPPGEPRYLLVPNGAGTYIVEDILDEAPGVLPSTALNLHTAALDPHPGYVLDADLTAHAAADPHNGLAAHAATAAQRAVLANGLSKPLSGFYGTLAAAQVDYPHAVALTDELDWAVAQAAVNAVPQTGEAWGADIRFGVGVPYWNRTLNCDDKRGIRLLGASGKWAKPGTHIKWTGTGTQNAISAKSAIGFEMHHICIEPTSAAYTGDLINFDWSASLSDATNILIADCWIGTDPAGNGGKNARSLIRMNKTIIAQIVRCQFIWSQVALRLGDPQYVVAITVDNCAFNYSSDVHILASADESVRIENCTMEPGALGENKAYRHSLANQSLGLVYNGNWHGDASIAGTWAEFRAVGLTVIGNRWSSIDQCMKLTDCQGVVIVGNQLGGSKGIEFVNTNYEVLIWANDLGALTTPYTNVTNAGVGSYIQSGTGTKAHQVGPVAVRGAATAIDSTLDRLVFGRLLSLPAASVAHGVAFIDDQADGVHIFTRSDYDTVPEIGLWTNNVKRLRVAPGNVQGNVEVLTGHFSVKTAGKGLQVAEGANAKQGIATLVGGTVTVANTSVTATSRIMLTVQSLGTVTTPKAVGVTARTAGTSFTITSADATDTSVIAYEIFEPGA